MSGRDEMTKPRRSKLAVLLAAVLIPGLIADARAQAPAADPLPGVRILRDQRYFEHPTADPLLHAFDLYLPENQTKVPVLFFVHGGGWRGGDKQYAGLEHIVRICADLGMGVMSVNYRVSPAVKHPVHMQDLARAFAWLYERAPDHGIDRDALFIAGGSAGGHLVALLGLDHSYLAAHGLPRNVVKGVMAFSGIYDLLDFPEPGLVPTRTEDAFGLDPVVLRSASPVTHVGRLGQDTPPFLISYTDDDLFEFDKQAQRLYSRFVERRLPAELIVQPGRTHWTKTSGIGNRGDGSADDVLGPAIKRFLTSVRDGTFAGAAAAAWYSSLTDDQPGPGPKRTIRMLQDLSYEADAGAAAQFHAFDLYLPEGRTNMPVLFFVHGGGWRAGDKAYDGLDRIVKICADLGMGVMSVNYRLSPAVKHPIHIEDVASAFGWLYRNAAEHGLNREAIFVAGGSAGGHLAALLGLDSTYLVAEGVPPAAVKGVMTFSGIYDLANFPEPGVVPSRKEQAFGVDYDVLKGASPVRYVGRLGAQTPPFLISYTDADLHGLDEQAERFYSLFVRHRLPAELVLQPGRTHQTKTLGIASKLDGVDDVLGPAIKRFLRDLMNGSFTRYPPAAWPTD